MNKKAVAATYKGKVGLASLSGLWWYLKCKINSLKK